MEQLRVITLGGLRLLLGDEPVTRFETRKAEALLVYLACNRRPYAREVLADLLWDERSQRQALSNLRVLLTSLKKQLEPYLIINRETIALDPQANSRTDVTEFESLLSNLPRNGEEISAPKAKQIEQAVELYQGDFLEGFYVRDSPGFDEWMVREREWLHRRIVDALHVLIEYDLLSGNYQAGIAQGTHLLALDPLDELAHRQMMQLLAYSGKRSEALTQYEACRRLLSEELGIVPSPQTEALVEKIRAGELTRSQPPLGAIRGYQLREIIGSGSYGAVYRAFQPTVGREVAVKVILPHYANNPEFIRRFEAEAQTVARLEHPHIVPLYDYWREPDGAYLVMRLLKGGNLEQLLEAGPVKGDQVMELVDQIAAGLTKAHQQDVVHRDIKPANILLDETGNAYLSDFGIAKVLGGDGFQTQAGGVFGTPNYMSPEQIRSQPVTPQSDIYSLGIVLYQMLTGKPPFKDESSTALMDKHLHQLIPGVHDARPDLPEEVDQVIQCATAKDPTDRYPDALTMAAALRQILGGSPGRAPLVMATVKEVANPYKGLRAFQQADAADFFGREELTGRLVARLGDAGPSSHFLAVVGPSGSGKSSLVKAGMIPALRGGALPGAENWFIMEMTPGGHPLEELEISLLRIASNPAVNLKEQLQRDERGILRAARLALPSEESELLLVIDQFEEVFTMVADESEARQFLQGLSLAVSEAHSPVHVVISLRADFFDRPLMDKHLSRMLQDRTEVVVPLSVGELERAVRSPAERVGIQVEPELVTAIVTEMTDQPGALPLLQYALTELFERRVNQRLTLDGYRAIGGVGGVLERRAEETFEELSDTGKAAARQVFLRLVTLGESANTEGLLAPDTRRRVLRYEIEALVSVRDDRHGAVVSVLDAFGMARLLSFDRDAATRSPTVEIAHEALLSEWQRLRGWLDESRDDVRMQRSLGSAAAEWDNVGQDSSYLLRGSRLEQFEGWAAQTSVALTQDESDFLTASTAERDQRMLEETDRQRRELKAAQKLAETERQRAEEQANARRRVQRWASFLAISLSLVALLAVVAFDFSQQSNRNTRIATARELASAALTSLQSDPERSILLALEAIKTEPLWEAQNALHQALYASHLRDILAAHEGGIYGIAASSDGNRLGTASLDGTIKIWQITDGRIEKQPLLTVPNPVDYDPSILGSGTTLAFSPDNNLLATFGSQYSVLILDAASGETVQTLSGHTAELTSLAFNSTGDRLLTSSADGTARLWDVSTGEELVAIQSDSGEELFIAAFSPGGELIATGGTDSVVRLWDLSGALLAELPIENGNLVTAIAFSPDGSQLAAGSPFSHRVWDLSLLPEGQSPRLVLTTPGENNPVNGIYFSPDGRWLITINSSGKSKIWDVSTGQVLLELLPSEAMLSSASTPDGKSIFIGYENGQVKAWNIGSLGNGEWLNLPYQYSVFHSREQRIHSFNVSDRERGVSEHSLWNMQGEAPQKVDSYSIEFGGSVIWDEQDDTLRRFALLDENGLVKIYDSADGRFLLSLASGAGEAKIGTMHMSSDGSRLITGREDGSIRVWDTATGSPVIDIQAANQQQLVLSSLDNSLIVSYDQDQNLDTQSIIRIWDAASGKKINELVGHTGRIFSCTFTPDGKLLLSSSADGTVKIWGVAKGNLVRTLSNFNGLPFSSRVSPNGKLLAVELSNLQTSLYNLSSGQELLDLNGWWASFSPDSQHLILGSTNEEMTYGYDLELNDLVKLAEGRVTRSLTEAECQKYLHTPTCK